MCGALSRTEFNLRRYNMLNLEKYKLSPEARAKNDTPILTMLTKQDGTEIEPIVGGPGDYWLTELIDDEWQKDRQYLQRNALPEEIEAFHVREKERAAKLAEEKRLEAEKREQDEAKIREIAATWPAHSDGKLRVSCIPVDGGEPCLLEFSTADEMADQLIYDLGVFSQYDKVEEPPAPIVDEVAAKAADLAEVADDISTEKENPQPSTVE